MPPAALTPASPASLADEARAALHAVWTRYAARARTGAEVEQLLDLFSSGGAVVQATVLHAVAPELLTLELLERVHARAGEEAVAALLDAPEVPEALVRTLVARYVAEVCRVDPRPATEYLPRALQHLAPRLHPAQVHRLASLWRAAHRSIGLAPTRRGDGGTVPAVRWRASTRADELARILLAVPTLSSDVLRELGRALEADDDLSPGAARVQGLVRALLQHPQATSDLWLAVIGGLERQGAWDAVALTGLWQLVVTAPALADRADMLQRFLAPAWPTARPVTCIPEVAQARLLGVLLARADLPWTAARVEAALEHLVRRSRPEELAGHVRHLSAPVVALLARARVAALLHETPREVRLAVLSHLGPGRGAHQPAAPAAPPPGPGPSAKAPGGAGGPPRAPGSAP